MESINLYADFPKHSNIFEFKGKIYKKDAISDCSKCAFFPDFSPESTQKECYVHCDDGSYTHCNIDHYIVRSWVVTDNFGVVICRSKREEYMSQFELDTLRENLVKQSKNYSISYVFIPKK
jgi:hypothetical protein